MESPRRAKTYQDCIVDLDPVTKGNKIQCVKTLTRCAYRRIPFVESPPINTRALGVDTSADVLLLCPWINSLQVLASGGALASPPSPIFSKVSQEQGLRIEVRERIGCIERRLRPYINGLLKDCTFTHSTRRYWMMRGQKGSIETVGTREAAEYVIFQSPKNGFQSISGHMVRIIGYRL